MYPEAAMLPHLHLSAVAYVVFCTLYRGPGWVVTRTPSRLQGSCSQGHIYASRYTEVWVRVNVAYVVLVC